MDKWIWIAVLIIIIVVLLVLAISIHLGPKYIVKAHIPGTLDNLTNPSVKRCCIENISGVLNNSTIELAYLNGPGLNLSIDTMLPVYVDTSYAHITKTLYGAPITVQTFNARLSAAYNALNIISNDGNVLETNFSDNTTELYVATNNVTIYYEGFDSEARQYNPTVPPGTTYSNGTFNRPYNSTSLWHLVFLINRMGNNLTTVAFYTYGNYSFGSSTSIAQDFLNLAIENTTIINATRNIFKKVNAV